MAMNGKLLGKEIADAIISSKADAKAKAAVLELWEKIGGAIVDHITTNAEVPAGITVKTTGSPTAQSGATDAPGSVI